MPYTVSTKLGSAYLESFSIADGTTNTTSTSIPLIGASAPPGYAKDIAKAMVSILSNGASAVVDRPANALIGQEWFDFTNKTMTVYTGASTGWKNILTEGSTNLIITPSQGGLGLVPTSASAGYVVRVNSSGSGYELTPGSFLRTDASSTPLVDNTYSIGSSTAKYKEIFSTSFIGNASSANKLSAERSITLTGDISGTVSFDGSTNVNMTTRVVGGNSSTATKLATPRSITLTGDIAGTVSFDGSDNVNMATTLVGGQLSAYIKRTGDTMDANVPLVGGIGPNGGFVFPLDPYGGVGDIAGMQMAQRSGEDTVLAIFNRNDQADSIQFNTGFYEFYCLNPGGATSDMKMIIANSGRVGIKTGTPTADLDVNGSMRALSILTDNATLTNITAASIIGTGDMSLEGSLNAKTRIDTPAASISNCNVLNLSVTTNTTLAGTTRLEGNATVTGTVYAGDLSVSASDKKLKTNIVEIQDALSMLKNISGYEYDFDVEKCASFGFTPTKYHEHGLIAQEVIAVLPDAEIDNGNYLNYRDRPVLALVVSAINQLDEKIEQIKKTLGI